MGERTYGLIVALLAFSAIPRHADAAGTATSACASASQQSVKLRAAHKLRQARDQAQICAAKGCTSAVRASCRRRVGELDAAIPTIVFVAKDPAGHDLVDVRVSMDGESLADRLDGTALSVEPGQHAFTFELQGQPSVDQSFLIVQGKKDRREIIQLAAPPPPPPPPPAPIAASVAASAPPDADAGASGSPGVSRPLAIAVGSVGVASLIAGAITGGMAVSKWSASQSECASPSQCAQHGQSVSDHDAASSLATVSTVTFIAGGATVAAATLLFFLAPSRISASRSVGPTSLRLNPTVGPGGVALTMDGVF